jgi:hypothetical protein
MSWKPLAKVGLVFTLTRLRGFRQDIIDERASVAQDDLRRADELRAHFVRVTDQRRGFGVFAQRLCGADPPREVAL